MDALEVLVVLLHYVGPEAVVVHCDDAVVEEVVLAPIRQLARPKNPAFFVRIIFGALGRPEDGGVGL